MKHEGLKPINELDQMLKENKSIANFAIGYFIARSCKECKTPIFAYDFTNKCQVLIEYLNMMFWINVDKTDVFINNEGVDIMIKHEIAKGVLN